MQQFTVEQVQPPFFSQHPVPTSFTKYPETVQFVYQEQVKRLGTVAADRWFANYIQTSPNNASQNIPQVFQAAVDKTRWQENKDEQLNKSIGERCFGIAAVCKAEDLIGPVWREKLGQAYPLVLLAVKSAVEGGHEQGKANDGTYHFLSTLPSLGVL